MPNAQSVNVALNVISGTADLFMAQWKLTRTMLSAGWHFKGCGLGNTSATVFLAAQTGTAASITAYSSPTQTITGLTNLTAAVLGQKITISNAATGGNNGTFIITSFVSATSVTVYNTTGTATDTNNGSIHWSLNLDTALDLWGTGGGVNLQNAGGGSGSGTGVSIAAASTATGQAVISGVTGFSISSVGDFLTITGSAATGGPGTSGTNNGGWRIIGQSGTTVTVYAPGLVAETSNASLTVTEQFGGADGSLTTFLSATSGRNTLINFTTSTFNSFSSSDVGRKISILNSASGNNGTYLIAAYVSTNNVLLYAGPSQPVTVTASDAGNPTLRWVEYDPRTQGYPALLANTTANNGVCHQAWWLAQGPTTMKIPIGNNAVTGTFIRGENVVQTTTGAQGELLGVVQDTSGGTGYLVVAPRVVGTGVQASSSATYGWNNSANTDTVTGALSGATVTTPASSTPIAYIRETCFWPNYYNSGVIYHQCVDQNPATESATTTTTGRFSTMANTLSQVASAQPPASSAGSTPTTNGFPTTGSYAVQGEVTQGSTNTYWSYIAAVNVSSPGRAHLLCANNIEQQGVSQDGSWAYLQSCATTGYQCVSYQRVDNQEDGDLDPYVHQAPFAGTLNGAANRIAETVQTAGGGSTTDNMRTDQSWINSTSYHGFKGFRRRGLSGETYNWFSVAMLQDFAAGVFLLQTNTGNPDQVGTAVTTTYVREPLWLWLTPYTAQLASGRMRKGTPRWLQLTQGGTVNSTFDNLEWIILTSASGVAQFVAGPWDGATTPSF
jgi:hypothetical protein